MIKLATNQHKQPKTIKTLVNSKQNKYASLLLVKLAGWLEGTVSTESDAVKGSRVPGALGIGRTLGKIPVGLLQSYACKQYT